MQSQHRSSGHASQVCVSCKIRKRKCDKRLPKCSLCARKNWTCQYSTYPTSSGEEVESSYGRHTHTRSSGIQEETSVYRPFTQGFLPFAVSTPNNRPNQNTDALSVFFLDLDIFQRHGVNVSNDHFAIPPAVINTLGTPAEVQETASWFFKYVHPWIPIISKKRLYERLLHISSRSSPDVALLHLSMKLLKWRPSENDGDPRTPLYSQVKQYYLTVETAGIFSIQALQAGILIAVYELGHGVYPSAYMSIASCARYGYSLGINPRGTHKVKKPFSWVELEEEKRVWWAIIIVDRFVSLGCPGRPFASEDPQPEDSLPSDDALWDQGIMPTGELFTTASPSSANMGRFTLVAHIAKLLSQVLRHVSDNTSDARAHYEEAIQLDRTIHALLEVSETESQESPTPICNQSAILESTLMILHERYSSPNVKSLDPVMDHTYSRSVIERIAKDMAAATRLYFHVLPAPAFDDFSPFFLHTIYQCAATYVHLYQVDKNPETLESLDMLKKVLKVLDGKWRVAGMFFLF
ncbi:hypothetical protein F5884DRAFT_759321 [Xylogone sp. PMI_703]|nr:hypothetical protein F5884DRAFT_759321 [Xylogone sp. PMI_703]